MGIGDHHTKRRSLSLDKLEGIASPLPQPGDTSLVTKCLHLRRVPIGEFTAGDLRIMIGQREGLMFLLPLAIEQLRVDPLVDASYYPGDLLCAILGAGREFWQRHAEQRASVEEIVAGLADMPEVVTEALCRFRADGETGRRR